MDAKAREEKHHVEILRDLLPDFPEGEICLNPNDPPDIEIVLDNKPTHAHIKQEEQQQCKEQSNKQSPSTIPLLECHTFPLPRVTGSRNNLKVMIPVPNYIFTQIPIEEIKHLSFSITPILFNIGINEHATLAGKFGNNGPQVCRT